MANHNTADIKYCLKKIVKKNSAELDATELNVELMFMKHQQKLNKRLMENSKALMSAIEQLQQAHQRVMKTNEEIVSFNLSMLEATSEIISTDELPSQMRLTWMTLIRKLKKLKKVVFCQIKHSSWSPDGGDICEKRRAVQRAEQ